MSDILFIHNKSVLDDKRTNFILLDYLVVILHKILILFNEI